jgi:predicted SAM-dependent methyltransferase
MAKILVLGCGKKVKDLNPNDQIVTLDINPNVGADVIHDLSKFPWPFVNEEFDVVHMEHVLEHLHNVIATMEEIHRITKPQAQVIVTVPYFRSKWAWVDPTHVHCFTAGTMNYFIDGHAYRERYVYTTSRFKMNRITFNEGIDQTWFQKLLIPIAQNYTEFYENKISPIFPLETLTYKMETVKT